MAAPLVADAELCSGLATGGYTPGYCRVLNKCQYWITVVWGDTRQVKSWDCKSFWYTRTSKVVKMMTQHPTIRECWQFLAIGPFFWAFWRSRYIWADPKSRSSLRFHSLHQRSIGVQNWGGSTFWILSGVWVTLESSTTANVVRLCSQIRNKAYIDVGSLS